MSGRTFTYQGSFDDFSRQLVPDLDPKQRRKSVGIGDGLLRELEEFINRFVVTATNDAGDVTFDAAGSYTFQGDVTIEGDLTIATGGILQSSNWVSDTSGWQLLPAGTGEFNGDVSVNGDITTTSASGKFRTASSGKRLEMTGDTTTSTLIGGSREYAGIDMFSSSINETTAGLLGVYGSTTVGSTVLAGPDVGSGQAYLGLSSGTVAGETRLHNPDRTYLTAGGVYVDMYATGGTTFHASDFRFENLSSTGFLVINSGGDVGIGTSSPETPLNIVTTNKLGSTFTGTTDGEGLRVDQSNYTANNYVSLVEASYDDGQTSPHVRMGAQFTASGSKLVFGTSDTYSSGITNTALTIDSGGNVGIGTTSPSNELDVQGASNPEIRILSTDASDPALVFGDSVDGARASIYYDTSANDLLFRGYNNSTRMTIDSAGNVGIGTTSPSRILDVRGIARVGDDTDRTPDAAGVGHLMVDGNGYGGFVSLDGAAMWVGHNASSRKLYLATNETARLTVDGAGKVGIGTTAPSTTLDVNGSLSKNSGSFKIPHPLPEMTDTHHLVHSFVEAPQADNIYRGRVELVDGAASVNIDEVAGMTAGTFVLLNRDVQAFTSNESGPCRVWSSVSDGVLTITAEHDDCGHEISWLVIGERQDQHMYDTEWTDDDGRVIVEPVVESTETPEAS